MNQFPIRLAQFLQFSPNNFEAFIEICLCYHTFHYSLNRAYLYISCIGKTQIIIGLCQFNSLYMILIVHLCFVEANYEKLCLIDCNRQKRLIEFGIFNRLGCVGLFRTKWVTICFICFRGLGTSKQKNQDYSTHPKKFSF